MAAAAMLDRDNLMNQVVNGGGVIEMLLTTADISGGGAPFLQHVNYQDVARQPGPHE